MTTYAPPFEIITAWTQPFATVGSWTRTQSANYLSGGAYFSPATINNSVSYRVALGVGTYTFTAIGLVHNIYGISTVALDGTSVGTLDWYSAGFADDTVKTITGISVTTAGVYTLSVTAAAKNASSSNYYQVFQLLALHRTDDASGPIVGATLPHRVDIIPWAGTQYAESGVSTRTQASTHLSGGRMLLGGATTIDNYGEWLVPLAAGTWSLTQIHYAFTDAGIITASLNGVDVSTVDHYAAAGDVNKVATTTGIVVAQDGIYKLRFRAAAKHASSTAYANRQVHLVLQRSGA